MTAVLTVPATDVRPFDGLTEGTVVTSVTWHEREDLDPATGELTRRPVVTIVSVVAQLVVHAEVAGQHVHGLPAEVADQRTLEWDETLRVARPAIVAPCRCGPANTASNAR